MWESKVQTTYKTNSSGNPSSSNYLNYITLGAVRIIYSVVLLLQASSSDP
jgi:hypothetical protein